MPQPSELLTVKFTRVIDENLDEYERLLASDKLESDISSWISDGGSKDLLKSMEPAGLESLNSKF